MAKSCNSGVYAIVNLANGKVYVGSSINLRGRESQHFRGLYSGNHPIPYLQRSWDKYGASRFCFVVLESCAPHECVVKEQDWLDRLQPYKFVNGYNRCPTAGSTLGFKHSEETKRKMSDRMTGVPMAEGVRKKIAESLRGKPKTAQWRANLWKNRVGWQHSEDSRTKISTSLLKLSRDGRRLGPPDGWKHSEEAKKRISERHKGVPKSSEHRARISAAVKAARARKRGQS